MLVGCTKTAAWPWIGRDKVNKLRPSHLPVTNSNTARNLILNFPKLLNSKLPSLLNSLLHFQKVYGKVLLTSDLCLFVFFLSFPFYTCIKYIFFLISYLLDFLSSSYWNAIVDQEWSSNLHFGGFLQVVIVLINWDVEF